ncbi:hypothetical protein NVIE_001220 [Nitrososphaera viennensis EN76]|uniref:Uncharacterized protein n=1 Tax=Nitrososphaera viennensis EN76 TaxID=926571 RepID=A0A060HBZ7_9ARCH|nr:hypothetical protein NVIE_001220 [Nitrososphaera viennensis EN76]
MFCLLNIYDIYIICTMYIYYICMIYVIYESAGFSCGRKLY